MGQASSPVCFAALSSTCPGVHVTLFWVVTQVCRRTPALLPPEVRGSSPDSRESAELCAMVRPQHGGGVVPSHVWRRRRLVIRLVGTRGARAPWSRGMPAHRLPGLPRCQTGSVKGPWGSTAALVRDLQNRVDLRRRSVSSCGPRCPIRACGCVCCKLTFGLAALEGPETRPAFTSSARDRLGFACSGLLSIGRQFGWSARLAPVLHRRRPSKHDTGRIICPLLLARRVLDR